jgi:hypothetical protein
MRTWEKMRATTARNVPRATRTSQKKRSEATHRAHLSDRVEYGQGNAL